MPESSVASGHDTRTVAFDPTTCGVVMFTAGVVTTGAVTSLDVAWGTTGFDVADATPVPALLVAVTLNRYWVPLVRPLTVQPAVASVVHVAPPGAAVTV